MLTTSPARRMALLLVLLLAIGGAVAVAGIRAHQAAAGFQRLSRGGPEALGAADVRDFVPLEVIARRARVPESALEDALRLAGFTVEPQTVAPEIPGPPALVDRLRRWLGFGAPRPPGPPAAPDRPRRPGAPRPDGVLDPAAQSLRQIARVSGRPSAEAVRVVREAVQAYHRQNDVTPPGALGKPGVPATPGGQR